LGTLEVTVGPCTNPTRRVVLNTRNERCRRSRVNGARRNGFGDKTNARNYRVGRPQAVLAGVLLPRCPFASSCRRRHPQSSVLRTVRRMSGHEETVVRTVFTPKYIAPPSRTRSNRSSVDLRPFSLSRVKRSCYYRIVRTQHKGRWVVHTHQSSHGVPRVRHYAGRVRVRVLSDSTRSGAFRNRINS